MDVNHGNHHEVASSSLAPSDFLPLRCVNASPGIAERRGNVCHTNMEVNFQYPRSTKPRSSMLSIEAWTLLF